MVDEKEISTTPQEVLLHYIDNTSENIEFTKNRSFALIVAYSAFCAFLINESQNIAETFLPWMIIFLTIGTVSLSLIIDHNYKQVLMRRKILKKIYKELKLSESLRKCTMKKLKNNDTHVRIAYFLYLIATLIVTIAWTVSSKLQCPCFR